MSSEPRFPYKLSNTDLAVYKKCPRRFWLGVCRRLIPDRPKSPSLVFGGAYAAGMEAARRAFWIDKATFKDAKARARQAVIAEWGEEPVEGNKREKTRDSCIQAVECYLNAFPLDKSPYKPVEDDKMGIGIECDFSIPLPLKVDGREVQYVGRLDMLIKQDGYYKIIDDKTTSRLTGDWGSKFQLSPQQIGYAWAIRKLGYDLRQVLIRGVCVYKSQPMRTMDYPISISPFLTQEWENATTSLIKRIISDWNQKDFQPYHGACSDLTGKCPFYEHCLVGEAIRERILATFIEREERYSDGTSIHTN